MLSRRPLFFSALAVCGGILLQYAFSLSLSCAAIIFSGLFFLLLITHFCARKNNCEHALNALLLVTLVFAGTLRLAVEEFRATNAIGNFAGDENEILLLGTVETEPRPKREHWRLVLSAQTLLRAEAQAIRVRGKVLVSGRKLQEAIAGEQIMLRGRLRLPDEARNPGAFDYRLYLKAQDIGAQFWCTQDSLLWRSGKPASFSMIHTLAAMRQWIAQQLARFSEGQALALLQGLLLGQREEIDDRVMASFAQTGLIHVLSVSGLHTGFIALILLVCAELMCVPKRAQGPLIILGLMGYVLLTGLQAPVVRATIMAIVLILGNVFERDGETYNSLGAAAIIILMWQPWQLLQLGFLLSFVAMWGIAYLYRPLRFWLRRALPWRWPPARPAITLLAVSFAAQLATLPFLIAAYGRLPVTAIWGNLIVIPISFFAVAAGVVACLVAPLSNFLLQVYGAAAELTVKFMIHFTQWLARLPGAYVEGVHAPLLLLLVYLLALAVFVEWRRKSRRGLMVAALAMLNVFIWREAWLSGPKLRLTFFDVGQGDAVLLEFPQGKRMLIDAGPWSEYSDAGERVLLPYFAQSGIRHLQAVVITHPHADHLGGLPALLSSWVKIDTVYFCGVEINSWLEQQCERGLDSLRVPYRSLHTGEALPAFAPAQIGVLAAGRNGAGAVENANNASVVLKILWGEIALLFAGDAEWQSEWRMTRRAAILDSDLLKAGHHGSQTSSTLPFLRAVTPQWAVISAGRRNKFGHPHPQVLARLDSLRIQSVRTDLNGAVIFETEGKVLKRLR